MFDPGGFRGRALHQMRSPGGLLKIQTAKTIEKNPCEKFHDAAT
jgi:hypothetical protein